MKLKTITFINKEVPHLILGSLTMSPLQRNLSPEAGGKVIAFAIKKGLRWIDSAQMYGSYPHVRRGIELSGIARNQLVISTKSTCQSYQKMKAAIDEAMQDMNCKYIDLFLLHAVRSVEDYHQRSGALQALLDARESGRIGAVGISTHSTKCAHSLADDIHLDWYHLMFNKMGVGLNDGTLEEQSEAIKIIRQRGGRFYAMKPLGGGYLGKIAEDSLRWVKDHPLVDAVALGMVSEEEVEMNIKIFSNQTVSKGLKDRLGKTEKRLFVFKPLCIACRECEKTCEQSAIHVIDKVAVVKKEKCILCGYCVPACPKFALRII